MLCARGPGIFVSVTRGACNLGRVVRSPSCLLAAAVVVVAGVVPSRARAGDPADEAVAARLTYLVGALEQEEPWARTWADGWTAGFAGLAMTQAALAVAATDGGVRAASISGAIKAGVGFAARLVLPFTARSAATRLRAVREDTPDARRAKLRAAEALLAQSAREEGFSRSWVPLGLGVALNLSSTFILWAGFHRAGAGWFGLGAGTTVSQLQFWTQPTGAIGAWDAYTRGAWKALPRAPALRWSVTPAAGGLAVQRSF
jgi:hypothetical protein